MLRAGLLGDERPCREFECSQIRSNERGGSPFMQGMLAAAIEAPGNRKLNAATGACCPGFESVKGLSALAAFPVGAERRSGMAGWAGVSGSPRQLGEPQESSSMLKSAPAVHQDEDGKSPEPHRPANHGESDESEHSE